MKIFGITWLLYFLSSGLLELPVLHSPILKHIWFDRSLALQTLLSSSALSLTLPAYGWMSDPAILSRAASDSLSSVDGTALRSNRLRLERSTATPLNTSFLSINDPIRKLYGRLSPWVRGDRPGHLPRHDVRLIRADVRDRLSATAKPVALFQACELEGSDVTQASTYAIVAPYQIWVKGQLAMALSEQTSASALVQRLRLLLETPSFQASSLTPGWVDGSPAILANNHLLLKIDPLWEQSFQRNAELITIDWTNNLRRALGAKPLSLVEAQTQMYDLVGSHATLQEGMASWYGPYFHKRLTANGERFNQYGLTAAHKTLQFDTYMKVTNPKTDQSVIVRINDRGPYVETRSLDLSYQAARCIHSAESGIVRYKAVVLAPSLPSDTVLVQTPESPSPGPRQVAGNLLKPHHLD